MKGISVKKKLQNNGFSLKSVAEAMGETPQNLNSMLKAQDIKTGVLEEIAKAINKNLYFFFDENIRLMTPEEMDQHDKEVSEGKWNIGRNASQPAENHGKNTKNIIPLYSDVSSIGGINSMANTDGVSQPVEYIDTGDWFRGATAAIRHYGDSMIEYPPGSILALKEVQERQLMIWGEDYVIETNEYRITKCVQRGSDTKHISAYSSNKETYPDGRLIHEPINIAWEDVRKIFLVLGYVIKKNGGTMVYSSKK